MRIEWAIPCRYAEVNGSLVTIVAAQLNTFYVQELPTTVGCPIAIRMAVGEDELEDEHEIKLALKGPHMQDLGELRASFVTGPVNPDKEPGWETAIPTVQVVQFKAEEPGTYSIDMYIDELHKKTLSFLVRASQG